MVSLRFEVTVVRTGHVSICSFGRCFGVVTRSCQGYVLPRPSRGRFDRRVYRSVGSCYLSNAICQWLDERGRDYVGLIYNACHRLPTCGGNHCRVEGLRLGRRARTGNDVISAHVSTSSARERECCSRVCVGSGSCEGIRVLLVCCREWC